MRNKIDKIVIAIPQVETGRSYGDIRENPRGNYPQASLQFPAYEDFFPVSTYAKTYRNFFRNGDVGLTIISLEGCKWQEIAGENKKYCVFCDIGTKFERHDARFLGQWIGDSVNRYGKYGKVFLVDYADEATGAGIQWWKEALQGMPQNLIPHQDYGIKVYAKSGKGFLDSEELAKTLREIGVEDIHVGFEAATDEDLRSIHKGSLMRHHYQLIDIAKKYDFRVVAAFVLGAPTATQSSLEECVKFSEYMRDELGDNLIVVTGSPLMPLPGAPAWDMLREKAYQRREHVDLFETDNPDLHLARTRWYDWYCERLSTECGGAESAVQYAKQIGTRLNKMGSLPTQENEFG